MVNLIKKGNRGVALILALLVIVTLLILSGIMLGKAVTEYNLIRRNKLLSEAFYLAEGAVEKSAQQLAYKIANYLPTPDTLSEGLDISTDFQVSYGWEALSAEKAITDPYGITNFVRSFKLSGIATHKQYPDISVTINQIISLEKTYTFQHAVFYTDDLEMLPGANMTLSGRIHSNKDIYIAVDGSGNTLTVDTNYLYSAGNIYNKRKDSTKDMLGKVKIKIKDTSNYDYMKRPGEIEPLDSERSDWTDESQARWAGTVKSSVHGIPSLETPVVASIQPDGYYAENAGLKIVNGTAYDSGGNSVTLPPGTITESTIYNQREQKWVTVTNIDMINLNASGFFPANGLLYVTRTDATASQPNGIRIKNGSQLKGPLTVVSNAPVYIQGSYNNNIKKPAAIICDSLNILSNSWDDAHSQDPNLNNKIASFTEVNTAFISGVDTTTPGNYNGGLENYPRLHENWTGKTLKIRGAFVELWDSQIAQGSWHYGSPYYTAPIRDWNYDTDFNDSSKLPPFTPFAVKTRKVAWWKE